jgi:iron complex transport system substrate-binding protein
MKKWPIACAFLLTVSTALFAEAPYSVTDALGRTVRFDAVPERIVIAGRAVVSIVNALYLFPGAGRRVVGVGVTDQGLGDFFPVLDPGAADKARFPNDAGVERIAALKPDLVILKTYMRDPLGNSLDAVGIPVLYVDLESPDAFFTDLRVLGRTLRQPERAEQIIAYYQARIDDVKAAARAAAGTYGGGGKPPTVLIIQATESGGERVFSVPPASWIQTRMTETAGGDPVWKAAGVGSGWSRVGFEQIAAWNPDFILVVSYRTPAAAAVDRLKQSGDWGALTAVREGRLLPFPADYYSWDQPDARWILGLQWMAGVLNPKKFPGSGSGLKEAAVSFYTQLYGLDRAAMEKSILPRIFK